MDTTTLIQRSMSSLSISCSSSFLGQPITFHQASPLLSARTQQKQCSIVAKFKHWERKECKPNSLPVLQKMHVKVGDTVKVIAGDDKGKVGEVSKIYKHNSKIVVKDINLQTKHMKSKEQGEQGQIIKIEAPIHSSNVMLYSKDKEVTSRVGHKILNDGKRVRYLIKTGEVLDDSESWNKLKEEKNKKSLPAAAAAS